MASELELTPAQAQGVYRYDGEDVVWTRIFGKHIRQYQGQSNFGSSSEHTFCKNIGAYIYICSHSLVFAIVFSSHLTII